MAGASAGTFTTICFLYVLFRFPRFILYVKDGGAEPDVVVRLATFYSLNVSTYTRVGTQLLDNVNPTFTAGPRPVPLSLHDTPAHYRR